MARTNIPSRSTVVVLLIVAGLAGLLLWLTPYSIRHQQQEMQCRFRQRRVAMAILAWVSDHGRERFPPIVNPPPQTPWRPGRPGSLSEVLRDYLSGDDDLFRPRRTGETRIPSGTSEDESEQAYIARLRGRELTVCPVTEYEYWYSAEGLRNRSPAELARTDPAAVDLIGSDEQSREGTPTIVLRCQVDADGLPPHSGTQGRLYHTASIYPILRQVTPADVTAERDRLEEQERIHAGLPREQWTIDLFDARAQLEALERQLAAQPDGFIVTQFGVTIDAVVETP